MKMAWQKWADEIVKKTRRERVLFLLVGWVVVGFPLYFWWIEPTLLQLQTTKKQTQTLTIQQQESAAALAALNARLQQDPNQALRLDLQTTNSQLAQLDQALSAQTAGLIPADRMASTLQSMLSRSGKLQLQSLMSIKPTAVLPEASVVNYYRHGVKLVLQGRYADIYEYLHTLENLPQHFYWQSLHYNVDKYPLGTVEVILYTLSNSKEFIRG
jgi:MSHA biogenesis protein MshJ